ncbi:MAG TPA: DegV family protein [Solirubrobacterales bacterium]|nr:DegV family protein [Solirubrobacterales bacterium]
MPAGNETAVVCDSSQYLPSEVIAAKGIGVVSLYVSIDGEQEAELRITDYDDFYNRLRHSSAGATTSQPSLGDFIDAWEPLLDRGKEIVSIHLSSAISGTFEAANQARQRLIDDGKGGERVHLYDSEMACGATGLCVLAAAAAIEAGGGPEEAIARARQVRETIRMWFAVDTLEYLRKGGRIGGASAWIGGALKIKPILAIDREIVPIERVRTRARSLERLRGYARQLHESGADAWVIQHIQDHETADLLAADCREIFGCEPAFVSEIGPVIGAHVGPGLIGVGGVSWSLLDAG